MMGVEEYIHALSQTEFVHGANRDLPSWSSARPSDHEHVAVLDGLALLLVFAAMGDVAATTYWLTLHCCGAKTMLSKIGMNFGMLRTCL